MQIETFKIFRDLAESGSFSRAAVSNGITQSAVSQQIRALEVRFQVSLIERGRRAFALTAEGEAFLGASREIVDVYEHLDDRIKSLSNIVEGQVRIGVIYSIGLHELPPYIKAFRAAHPGVEVHVEYRRSWELYNAVQDGEVELGLVCYPAKKKGLLILPFLNDRMVLICHPSHPLAQKPAVSLADLEGERFIAFEPDQPTRKVIDRALRDHGVHVHHAIEFDSVETVKRAVEIENGISIVPARTVRQEVENHTLTAVEIANPQMWRPLGILLKRERSRSPALREFVAQLKKPLEV
ncbi:MAG TPA: LysR family transcriptional regulator [Chthoniobacteraceae bacterium]|jgi:DNA-binding transcriptional LysR family regulator|nr:LysR family transcriptional regulator [Chthoniobacteraceae bacterium]